jgi:hypothetical protein
MSTHRHLIRSTASAAPLSAEQRRFNQLLARLDKARAELQAWVEQARLYAVAHAQRVEPLQAELQQCQLRLVRRLDALLGERGAKWTPSDRRRIREDLCNLSAGLLEHTADETVAAELRALFERHAGHDIDTDNREAMAAMKALTEAMTGLDLGDGEFADEEALLRAMLERGAQAQRADTQPEPEPEPERKPSAAQRRRERELAEASQSLREVYRKLAAALHPDRASDAADRARRDALMPRVNQAYEARDLLALLSLQLEIEQVDVEHMARTTAARARQYNRLLGEQLAEIQAEIDARRMALCRDYGLAPYPPPRLDRLGAVLEETVRTCRAHLAAAHTELAQLDDPVQAKSLLRRHWRAARGGIRF